MNLVIDANLRNKTLRLAVNVDAIDASLVVGLLGQVFAVCQSVGNAQIDYPVIRLVVIDVINLSIRPRPVMNRLSDSMCKQLCPVNCTVQIPATMRTRKCRLADLPCIGLLVASVCLEVLARSFFPL